MLRVVLGETTLGFGGGGDAGRDAFYRGTPTGKLKDQFGDANFIVQCKHTSQRDAALVLSTIKLELPKLRMLAHQYSPITYIILTNRRLTSASDSEIREAVLAVPGVTNLLILHEQWFEDTIDSEPRLLRLVPRLYGVGDLTQILSFSLEQQSRALLEAFLPDLKTFVPTESYTAAEKVLTERRMVVLVGPPASGKSTIAANLCAVWSAQTEGLRALKLDKPDHFTQAWSPDDPQCIYWVDDIFGETTLDDDLLREWSRCLSRLEAAARKGAMVIVGTRDYILNAADQRLKVEKTNLLRDASVRVRVDNLQLGERHRILYNHIKHGDLPTEVKRRLKPFLPEAAGLASFSPELARRLGHIRFQKSVDCTSKGLRNFFDNPVDFFTDTMAALAPDEMAALTACLLYNNALPDPVPDECVPDELRRTYGVGVTEIRQALERVEGTFSRREPVASQRVWRLHHPSMVEALQTLLRASSAYLELYLRGAQVHALLRDTATITVPRLVLIPAQLFALLAERLKEAGVSSEVARYLANQSSREFLEFMGTREPQLMNQLLSIQSSPGDRDEAVAFGQCLHRHGLLTDERRQLVLAAVREAFEDGGAYGFMEVEGVSDVFGGDALKKLLTAERDSNYPGFERLCRWFMDDLSSVDAAEQAIEVLERYGIVAARLFVTFDLLEEEGLRELGEQVAYAIGLVQEKLTELEEDKAKGDDYEFEMYKESSSWSVDKHERGIFSDVDE